MLKHCKKYIIFMACISCVALLSIELANRDFSNIKDKSSRIIIKSTEMGDIPDIKELTNDERTRVTIPATNDNAPVQSLPVPNTNVPIVISPLS
ncbi:hypothetical protein [Clostridium sp. C2-6-12]|uniref:hypothetical protein n=1 Tax=Clostridium sp. C2-6-12 TaxID=2698832 RepID=UPI00136A017C|nr:hypothetical protein [Clostridium sp. C2-6-12]